MKLSDEYRLLVDCCRTFSSSEIDKDISLSVQNSTLDWDFVLTEASYHEISGVLYKRLKGLDLLSAVPKDIVRFLRHSYVRTLFTNTNLQGEYFRILSVFRNKGIECLPLKGISFIHDIYDDVALRLMGDIDVIVKAQDADRASSLLVKDALYYKSSDEKDAEDSCHMTFIKSEGNVPLELHVDFDYPLEVPQRIVIPGVWGRMLESRSESEKSKVLSPEDTIFSLAMHTRRTGKQFILKYICDIDRLVRKYGHKLDWGFIIDAAKRFKVVSPCFVLLKVARDIFSTPMPRHLLDRLYAGTVKSCCLRRMVTKSIFIKKGKKRNLDPSYSYLFSYILLYDRLTVSLKYILFISKERFIKFYGLHSKSKRRVEFFYVFRMIYIPFKLAVFFFQRCEMLIRQYISRN